MRTHYCGQVNESLTGQVVTVAGWAHRRRDHGGVIFVDLRDREGLLQIVFDPDKAAVFAMAERVRNEFVLKVTGLVRMRLPGMAGSTAQLRFEFTQDAGGTCSDVRPGHACGVSFDNLVVKGVKSVVP